MKNLITYLVSFLGVVAISGCKEDKILLDENTQACMDIAFKKPVISITGNSLLGSRVQLVANMKINHSDTGFYWQLPSGTVFHGKELKVAYLDSSNEGTYYVWYKDSSCISAKEKYTLTIQSNSISNPGCTTFDNKMKIQEPWDVNWYTYDVIKHGPSGSTGKQYSIETGNKANTPKLYITINRPVLEEGMYLIDWPAWPAGPPNYTARYCRIAMLDVIYNIERSNYSQGVLHVKKREGGGYDAIVCDVPFKRHPFDDDEFTTFKLVCK